MEYESHDSTGNEWTATSWRGDLRNNADVLLIHMSVVLAIYTQKKLRIDAFLMQLYTKNYPISWGLKIVRAYIWRRVISMR